MATGPLRARISGDGATYEKCRCTIGHDHDENGWNGDYDEDESSEGLSLSDAADIWRSKGMDEDYMFGYSHEELRDA